MSGRDLFYIWCAILLTFGSFVYTCYFYSEHESLVGANLCVGLSFNTVSKVTGDVEDVLGTLLHQLKTFTETGHYAAGLNVRASPFESSNTVPSVSSPL